MSQPTARESSRPVLVPVPVPVPVPVAVHSICPRPIISVEIQGIDESDYLLERYHDTWKYDGAKVDLLVICS